jgi:hypothetical protein
MAEFRQTPVYAQCRGLCSRAAFEEPAESMRLTVALEEHPPAAFYDIGAVVLDLRLVP